MAEEHDARPPSAFDRVLVACVGFLGAALLRLLGATWRIRRIVPPAGAERPASDEAVLFVLWHGHLLPLSYAFRGRGIVVLVSLHRDGEMIARTIGHLGYGTVRGSTTRGGSRALVRLAIRARQGASLGITPDGPRGPRHAMQPGAVTLASKTGLPIVLLAASGRPAWRAHSWDRFLVPKPFARVVVLSSEPIFVPRDLDRDAFETCRRDLEARLIRLCEDAERLA